jgi:hypothetical protein
MIDPEQFELASTGLATFDQHLGDHYRELSNSLESSLSGSAVTSPADAMLNKQMLNTIVGLMPHYGNEGIRAESPAGVRWLQSSVVELTDALGVVMPPPYYIVGHKDSGQTTTLLLHGVPSHTTSASRSEVTGEVIEVPVWKRAYARHASRMASKPTEVLDEAELARYHRHGAYYIGSPANGLTKINTLGLLFRSRALVFGTLAIKGVSLKPLPLEGLSDETLGRYHVFNHVNHLAASFDKVEQVQSIIQGNARRRASIPEFTENT